MSAGDRGGAGQEASAGARGEARPEAARAWHEARPDEVRWAAPRLLALFLGSRLLTLILAGVVEALAHPAPAGPGGSLLTASSRPLLASLTAWDGVYYVGIAASGYHAGPVNGPYPDLVFFPLYPLLTRLVAWPLGGDVALAAVLAANAALLLAMGLVYVLARERLAPPTALWATSLVVLQPGAVAFGMAYADSLFLLLVAGTFLAASRERRALAGSLSCLAALARLPGILLVAPLLVAFARRDGRRPAGSWLWAFGGPLGLGLFCAWTWAAFGDPLAPLRAQAAWDMGHVPGAVAPLAVLVAGGLVYVPTALAELWILVGMWRRGDQPVGLGWGVATLALVAVARRVASLPRYLAPLVQVAEALAARPPGVRWLVLVGATAGFVVLAALHFALLLAP